MQRANSSSFPEAYHQIAFAVIASELISLHLRLGDSMIVLLITFGLLCGMKTQIHLFYDNFDFELRLISAMICLI